jgi:hypothetical protein
MLWVLRRGFADNCFRAIAHPPERWVGVTERAVLLATHSPSWREVWRYGGSSTASSPGRLPPVRFSGRAVIPGKCNTLPIFRGSFIAYEAVGLTTHSVMVSRKSGRAKYAPLWRCGGGGGRKPTYREKTQTRMFAFFSTSRPPATAGGCPSPFEPLMTGLRPERSVAEWREQTPPIVF